MIIYHTEPGMDELRTRVAGKEDMGALASLMTELGYPSPVEEMRRRFGGISTDPSYETFVVESGKEVVGMAAPNRGAPLLARPGLRSYRMPLLQISGERQPMTKSGRAPIEERPRAHCATNFSLASSALSLRRERAMIWRLISLVPSPISLILTCRQ